MNVMSLESRKLRRVGVYKSVCGRQNHLYRQKSFFVKSLSVDPPQTSHPKFIHFFRARRHPRTRPRNIVLPDTTFQRR